MEKSKRLQTSIYQIIGENQFLLDSINSIIGLRDYYNIDINIVYYRVFSGSSNDGRIFIGIPVILDFYTIANELFPYVNSIENFIINTKYSDFGNKDSIRNIVSVHLSNAEQTLVDKELDSSDIFISKKLSDHDKLTVYALAYSLCHEIGHVIHDRDIPQNDFFSKEHIADRFSFEAIKNISYNNDESRLKGAIIGITQMLMYRTPQQEIDDKEHPHSIERLYSLLDFWGIEDESPYWELAYNIVQIWCNKNDLSITWERDTSLSFKDKFIDAYLHFRKKTKYIE